MWSFALDLQQRRMDISRFAALCRELGVEQVELVDYFWVSAGQPLSALHEVGLKVCAYDTATDFVHLAPTSRLEQVKLAYAVIEEAVRIGAQFVRLLPGYRKPGIGDDDALQMVVESVSAVARYAYNAGIAVVLEPHGDVVYSAETLRYIAEQVHSGVFGANADLCTFLLSGLDPVSECAAIADLCRFAHLNDVRRVSDTYSGYRYGSVDGHHYAGTAVGYGEIDIRQCLQGLVSAGFQGPFSVEYLGMEGASKGVPRSLEKVRTILQEVRGA
jgi:sugar phosphate isomerase/epimerase